MDFPEIISKYLARTSAPALRPRAALIDMDGTLYESMSHHTLAWKMMADEARIPAERDEFYLYEGRTGASTINILFQRAFGRDATEQEAKDLYAIKSRNFNAMPPVEVMPGAQQLMQALKAFGIKRVLVTGSGQSSLIGRLDADFPGIFRPELRITAANTPKGKPHPAPYLRAQELALAQPWQCIAIENAPLGVESASRSGAFTVGVSTGPIPSATLAEAGADVVFDSMPHCAKMLPELIKYIYSL